jgi:hypothetical protein
VFVGGDAYVHYEKKSCWELTFVYFYNWSTSVERMSVIVLMGYSANCACIEVLILVSSLIHKMHIPEVMQCCER